jgi:ribosomal subunit interface protein
MQLHISGKHVDLGESFQKHAVTRLEDGLNKYLDRVVSADVVVSKESHQFRIDIHANTGTHSHLTLKSKALATDVYAAFDQAVDRIEKQLARYKNRIRNHHGVKPTREAAVQTSTIRPAKKYVLKPEDDRELESEGAPAVIAEKATEIETLSVSEAVMKMDLSDLPALMFFNSSHGRINVIYRRHDGNISWVDPEGVAA